MADGEDTPIVKLCFRPPNERVIQYLSKLLERAKRGEIQGIVSVLMDSGGNMGQMCASVDASELIKFIGALEVAKFFLTTQVAETYDNGGNPDAS